MSSDDRALISRTHASGNYHADKQELQEYLDLLKPNANVLSTTETAPNAQIEVLQGQKGWGAAAWKRGPAGACSTIWRESVFEAVEHRSVELSTETFFTRKGHEQMPLVANVVVLRHRESGILYVPITLHMPSHIDGMKGNPRFTKFGPLSGPPRRVTTYVAGLKGWRRLRNGLRRKYPDAVLDLCWDTNLDHKKAIVRAFMRVQAGGYLTFSHEANRRVRKPGRRNWHRRGWKALPGTHHRRLIDVSRLYWNDRRKRVTVEHVVVVTDRRPRVFDHRAFTQRLLITRKR